MRWFNLGMDTGDDMLDEANVLLVLAVILVAGTLSGSLAKLLKLPSVTGQILIGVLIGPAVLNVLSLDGLHQLDPLVDFALGLMAVAVGSHLEFQRLRAARNRLLLLMLLESTLTPAVVFGMLYLFTDTEWTVSLLLATIAISTAPATVLALVKETASRGSFVTTLIAAVALNNLSCIILFELARTIARASLVPGDHNLIQGLLQPLTQIVFSILMGFAVGLLLIGATRRVVRTDRLSAFSLIAILLTAGLSHYFGLSVLLACLTLGVTLANVTPHKQELGHRVFDSFEPAIFAVFFTVAGMELEFEPLLLGGFLALMTFTGRLIGKTSAGFLSMRLAGATDRLRRWIGLSLIPQAGLAVGLMLLVSEDTAFASISELFLAVVLAMVLLNEAIGPILTRQALRHSGDFGRDRARILDFLSEHNITTELVGPDKESAIRQLVSLTLRTQSLSLDEETIVQKVLEAETLSSSCVGEGLALPHARIPGGDSIVGAMGINQGGLPLDSPDGRPVHCMVLILTPDSMPEQHLRVLGALAASIGSDPAIQQQLYGIRSPTHADELIHVGDQFNDWNYYLDE
ncbi:MAG: cation:proton antiporter [Planctomycetaceae bacterium]